MMKIKLNKRKLIITTMILVVTTGIAGIVLSKRNDDAKVANTSNTTIPVAENTINYNPPTQEEKDQAEQNKDDAVERSKLNETPASASIKAVNPVITSIEQGDEIVVAGYVSGVFEDGGTCTITATKDSLSTSGTSVAFENVNTTSCPPIRIKRSTFSESGSWNFVLKYGSSTSQGVSSVATKNIQ